MERRRPGRPAHEPSAGTRRTVETMVREGKTVREIALAIGLSTPTLRAHYAEQLAAPRPQINFGFAEDGEKEKRPGSPRAGRPEHVPTEETRQRVEILVAGGMAQWQIAAAIGVSEPVLRDRYATELEGGRSRRMAQVIEARFQAAIGGNVSAQNAWLSRHGPLEDAPEEPAKTEPLGKKEAAQMAALTAHQNSDWENLLPN